MLHTKEPTPLRRAARALLLPWDENPAATIGFGSRVANTLQGLPILHVAQGAPVSTHGDARTSSKSSAYATLPLALPEMVLSAKLPPASRSSRPHPPLPLISQAVTAGCAPSRTCSRNFAAEAEAWSAAVAARAARPQRAAGAVAFSLREASWRDHAPAAHPACCPERSSRLAPRSSRRRTSPRTRRRLGPQGGEPAFDSLPSCSPHMFLATCPERVDAGASTRTGVLCHASSCHRLCMTHHAARSGAPRSEQAAACRPRCRRRRHWCC